MFVVIEIQVGENIATLVTSYKDRNEAEAKYHTILAYASKSNMKKHGAVMLTEEGYYIKSECYEHTEEGA